MSTTIYVYYYLCLLLSMSTMSTTIYVYYVYYYLCLLLSMSTMSTTIYVYYVYYYLCPSYFFMPMKLFFYLLLSHCLSCSRLPSTLPPSSKLASVLVSTSSWVCPYLPEGVSVILFFHCHHVSFFLPHVCSGVMQRHISDGLILKKI